ncbi:unnamed protein product, partial [Mesorhabditis spiculigera]
MSSPTPSAVVPPDYANVQNGFGAATAMQILYEIVEGEAYENLVLLDNLCEQIGPRPGTFDTQAEIDESINYFSTSLLLSSIQIFNVSSKLDATDFDSLSTFINYSGMTGTSVNQHIIFLIRDAMLNTGLSPDFLSNIRDGALNSPALLGLIDGVFNAFDRADTYLVPPPQPVVRSKDIEIFAKECGRQFLTCLSGVTDFVIAQLRPKCILGQPLDGPSFRECAKEIFEKSRSKAKNRIGSFFDGWRQLLHERARNAALSRYEELWRAESHEVKKPEAFDHRAEMILRASMKAYAAEPTPDDSSKFAVAEKFRQELKAKNEARSLVNSKLYEKETLGGAVDAGLRAYDIVVQPLLNDFFEEVTAGAAVDAHNQGQIAAIEAFDRETTPFLHEYYGQIRENRERLVALLENKLTDLRHGNALNWIRIRGLNFVEGGISQYKLYLQEATSTVAEEKDIDAAIKSARLRLQQWIAEEEETILHSFLQEQPHLDPEMTRKHFQTIRDKGLSRALTSCDEDFQERISFAIAVQQKDAMMQQRLAELEDQRALWEEQAARLSADSQRLQNMKLATPQAKQRALQEAQHKEAEARQKRQLADKESERLTADLRASKRLLAERRESTRKKQLLNDRRRQEEAERRAVEAEELQKIAEGTRIQMATRLAMEKKVMNDTRLRYNKSEAALGIDLGTTYSAVAVFVGDEPVILPNEYGNRTTPSQVAFSEGKTLVGDAAKNQGTRNSGQTIYEIKRLMGRPFCDEHVKTITENC